MLKKENNDLKESNTVLLQIKSSHENLTITLKETE
jgi:hypothetical protein